MNRKLIIFLILGAGLFLLTTQGDKVSEMLGDTASAPGTNEPIIAAGNDTAQPLPEVLETPAQKADATLRAFWTACLPHLPEFDTIDLALDELGMTQKGDLFTNAHGIQINADTQDNISLCSATYAKTGFLYGEDDLPAALNTAFLDSLKSRNVTQWIEDGGTYTIPSQFGDLLIRVLDPTDTSLGGLMVMLRK